MAIRSKSPSHEKISIIPHSSSELIGKPTTTTTTSTKMNTLRNIKWRRQSAFRIDRNKQNREN